MKWYYWYIINQVLLVYHWMMVGKKHLVDAGHPASVLVTLRRDATLPEDGDAEKKGGGHLFRYGGGFSIVMGVPAKWDINGI